ncbi:GBP4-like protein [Mya arenaria]|uniref:GBP4-like protein n=2 Tax=Mya arenaria TaxID=6604 RepID=A0ABY7DE07_MYAAR|nr:GBP4-like protein [Mya arenaria]
MAPCINDAMKRMADEENQFAVMKASECYKEEMKKRINKIMPNERGLEKYHTDCMDEAMKILKDIVVVDDGDIFHRKTAECFEDNLKRFKSYVERDSLDRCRRSLKQLDMKIQQNIREKKYAHVRGYSEYMEDIKTLADKFIEQEYYLGPMTKAALQEYMDTKVEEEQLVYEMVKDKLDAESECQLHRLSSSSVPMLRKFADVTEGEQSVEKKALESFEKLESDGRKSIGSQYLENLKMKTQEIEQAKAELSEDDIYYKKLVAECDIWDNIYKQAKFAKNQKLIPSEDIPFNPREAKRQENLKLKSKGYGLKKAHANPECQII